MRRRPTICVLRDGASAPARSHARSGAMPVGGVPRARGGDHRSSQLGMRGGNLRVPAGRPAGAAYGRRDELIILAAGSPRPRAGMAGMHPAGTELILGAANSEPPGLREAEGGAQHPATRSDPRTGLRLTSSGRRSTQRARREVGHRWTYLRVVRVGGAAGGAPTAGHVLASRKWAGHRT